MYHAATTPTTTATNVTTTCYSYNIVVLRMATNLVTDKGYQCMQGCGVWYGSARMSCESLIGRELHDDASSGGTGAVLKGHLGLVVALKLACNTSH